MIRYNLEGDKIKVIKCCNCGHEVDITKLERVVSSGVNGLDCDNVLVVVSSIMWRIWESSIFEPCCDAPDYNY